jgi:tRNA 2-thiouridine synthesizing protein A
MPAMMQHSDLELDLSGLTCPLPLLKTKQALNRLEPGSIIKVTATDPASERDFQTFSRQSGVPLLHAENSAGKFVYWLRKP